ncbi:MAG TPA: hypothetical protein VMT88_10425 [Actinomycetes bacterium]|nr:hypothetical protein [Actinomycetes bacterium]
MISSVGPRLVIELKTLGQPGGNQALTKHVLHWLAAAKVDPKGLQRRVQPNLFRAIDLSSHADRLLSTWPGTDSFEDHKLRGNGNGHRGLSIGLGPKPL